MLEIPQLNRNAFFTHGQGWNFGLKSDFQTVGLQLIYALVYFLLLFLLEYDRYSLDGMRKGRTRSTVATVKARNLLIVMMPPKKNG